MGHAVRCLCSLWFMALVSFPFTSLACMIFLFTCASLRCMDAMEAIAEDLFKFDLHAIIQSLFMVLSSAMDGASIMLKNGPLVVSRLDDSTSEAGCNWTFQFNKSWLP